LITGDSILSKFKDHEEFFRRAGDHYVKVSLYGDSFVDFTVEDLYQNFKRRIVKEILPLAEEDER
jgi:hypothetical protein